MLSGRPRSLGTSATAGPGAGRTPGASRPKTVQDVGLGNEAVFEAEMRHQRGQDQGWPPTIHGRPGPASIPGCLTGVWAAGSRARSCGGPLNGLADQAVVVHGGTVVSASAPGRKRPRRRPYRASRPALRAPLRPGTPASARWYCSDKPGRGRSQLGGGGGSWLQETLCDAERTQIRESRRRPAPGPPPASVRPAPMFRHQPRAGLRQVAPGGTGEREGRLRLGRSNSSSSVPDGPGRPPRRTGSRFAGVRAERRVPTIRALRTSKVVHHPSVVPGSAVRALSMARAPPATSTRSDAFAEGGDLHEADEGASPAGPHTSSRVENVPQSTAATLATRQLAETRPYRVVAAGQEPGVWA